MSPRRPSALPASVLVLGLLAALLLPGPARAQGNPRQLILQGERFLTMGKPQAAITEYGRVLECCEQSAVGAEAHNDTGVAYAQLGDLDQAMAHYQAAIDIADYPLAWFNLGKALLKRRDLARERGADPDPADAERARGLLTRFRDWLAAADPATLPRCITWQRDEFEADLAKALKAAGE
ncbi:MAG: tetratricopeptide repeat protein [Desulfovibrionaceae bacterium]